eukprot:gene12814-12913_t
MAEVRLSRSTAILATVLCAVPALGLGACNQSAQMAELEQRIAAAEARAAAAEKRIELAEKRSSAGSASGQSNPYTRSAPRPVENAALAENPVASPYGLQDAPYRDSHSGPTNEVP